jgi:catechol-2,3-dioxygenase
VGGPKALSSAPRLAFQCFGFALLSPGRSGNLRHLMFELEGLDHVALCVRDAERSANWYVDVLGFERRYPGMWEGVPIFVGLGKTAIALFPQRNADANPPQSRESAGIVHLALRADRKNFAAAQRELTARGIAFHFSDHEISHSIYFRDPDGIELEITTYDLE